MSCLTSERNVLGKYANQLTLTIFFHIYLCMCTLMLVHGESEAVFSFCHVTQVPGIELRFQGLVASSIPLSMAPNNNLDENLYHISYRLDKCCIIYCYATL